jgi:5-methylcytosine-specific restriction endonuclease McrA
MTFDSTKYHLGSLCKRGHDYDGTGRSLRRIKSYHCLKCLNEISEKYSKNNQTKRSDYQVKYYNDNLCEIRERQATYRKENKDKEKARHAKYNESNKDKLKEYGAKYRKTLTSKLVKKQYKHKRRAQTKNNNYQYVSPLQFKRVYELCSNKCVYCGIDKCLTLDHFTPLAKGGVHALGNLVIACKWCNTSKNAELDPFCWYSAQPFFSCEAWGDILEILKMQRCDLEEGELLAAIARHRSGTSLIT